MLRASCSVDCGRNRLPKLEKESWLQQGNSLPVVGGIALTEDWVQPPEAYPAWSTQCMMKPLTSPDFDLPHDPSGSQAVCHKTRKPARLTGPGVFYFHLERRALVHVKPTRCFLSGNFTLRERPKFQARTDDLPNEPSPADSLRLVHRTRVRQSNMRATPCTTLTPDTFCSCATLKPKSLNPRNETLQIVNQPSRALEPNH